MSSAGVFWAFREFCASVIHETGHPPESVTLPPAAFAALEKEIGARVMWVATGTPHGPGITYETGHGRVLIQRSLR